MFSGSQVPGEKSLKIKKNGPVVFETHRNRKCFPPPIDFSRLQLDLLLVLITWLRLTHLQVAHLGQDHQSGANNPEVREAQRI